MKTMVDDRFRDGDELMQALVDAHLPPEIFAPWVRVTHSVWVNRPTTSIEWWRSDAERASTSGAKKTS